MAAGSKGFPVSIQRFSAVTQKLATVLTGNPLDPAVTKQARKRVSAQSMPCGKMGIYLSPIPKHLSTELSA